MLKAFVASIGAVFVLTPLFAHAEFYSFEENTKSEWREPADLVIDSARMANDLLKWIEHSAERPEPSEKYNRLTHFGTWINDPRTPECYDTRALALIRDSVTTVKFSEGSPCKVASGEWNDPYGGQTWKTAKEVEIDHVVALKNAYMSGAWAWDYQHRCLYANFLGYKNHLISASMRENRIKSDHGPEEWMPSDQSYACQHLQNWLSVKYIWNLTMTQAEGQAIESEIEKNHCSIKGFQISKAEVGRVRRFAEANLDLCTQH